MTTTIDIKDKDLKRIKKLAESKYTIDDVLIAGIILLEGCVAYSKEKENT